MYWRWNGASKEVCWWVCVSELWCHVNVTPSAPTRTWTMNKRWLAGFYVSVLSFIFEGLVSVTHFCCVLLFCFICTITFLFCLVTHQKRRKQISNNPVSKSVKTWQFCFERELYRSPRSLCFCFFPLASSTLFSSPSWLTTNIVTDSKERVMNQWND